MDTIVIMPGEEGGDSEDDDYEDSYGEEDEEEQLEYDESDEYSDEDEEGEEDVKDARREVNLRDEDGEGTSNVTRSHLSSSQEMSTSSENVRAKPPEMPAIPSDVSDMQPSLQKASSWAGPRSSWASMESIDSMEDAEGPVVRRGRPVLRRCQTDEPRKSVSFAAVLEEIYEVAALDSASDPGEAESSQGSQSLNITTPQGAQLAWYDMDARLLPGLDDFMEVVNPESSGGFVEGVEPTVIHTMTGLQSPLSQEVNVPGNLGGFPTSTCPEGSLRASESHEADDVGTLALKGEVSQPEYEPADEAKVEDDETLGLSVNISVADSDQPEVEPATLEHDEAEKVGDLETVTTWKRSTVRTKEASPAQASTSEVSVDQAGISSLTTQSLEEGVKKSLKEQMAAKLEARRRKLEGHFPDEPLEDFEGTMQEVQRSQSATVEEYSSELRSVQVQRSKSEPITRWRGPKPEERKAGTEEGIDESEFEQPTPEKGERKSSQMQAKLSEEQDKVEGIIRQDQETSKKTATGGIPSSSEKSGVAGREIEATLAETQGAASAPSTFEKESVARSVKQPMRGEIHAALTETASADCASSTSEKASAAGSFKQPMQSEIAAALAEKAATDRAPSTSEKASVTGSVKQPMQSEIAAALAEKAATDRAPSTSEKASVTGSVKQPMQSEIAAALAEKAATDRAPSTSEKASVAGSVKQPMKGDIQAALTETASADCASSTSEKASAAGSFKQPMQSEIAAALAEKAATDRAPSTSEKASVTGSVKQPMKGEIQAACSETASPHSASSTSEKASAAGSFKQPMQGEIAAALAEKAATDRAPSTSEKASVTGSVKQPMKGEIQAACSETASPHSASSTSEKASGAGSFKQPMQGEIAAGLSERASVDHAPSTSEKASVTGSVRQPMQGEIVATSSEMDALRDALKQARTLLDTSQSSAFVPLPLDHAVPAPGMFQQSHPGKQDDDGSDIGGSMMSKASPKFGSDMTDALIHHGQPRLGRVGSLPEPYHQPRLGILKKSKTESFVERPKALRFAAEDEIKEISPRSDCSPCSPSPLAQAVVVGTPVDPGSIRWLQQLGHGSLAASSADSPGPFGVLPPKTGSAASSCAGGKGDTTVKPPAVESAKKASGGAAHVGAEGSMAVMHPNSKTSAEHIATTKGSSAASNSAGVGEKMAANPSAAKPFAAHHPKNVGSGAAHSRAEGSMAVMHSDSKTSAEHIATTKGSSPASNSAGVGEKMAANPSGAKPFAAHHPKNVGSGAAHSRAEGSMAVMHSDSKTSAEHIATTKGRSAASNSAGVGEKMTANPTAAKPFAAHHPKNVGSGAAHSRAEGSMAVMHSDSKTSAEHIATTKGSSPASNSAGVGEKMAANPSGAKPFAEHSAATTGSSGAYPPGILVDRGRLSSMSLLPDLPSTIQHPSKHVRFEDADLGSQQGSAPNLSSSEASQGTTENTQVFKVKVEHQGQSHHRNESCGSESVSSAGFLVWKAPGACDGSSETSSAVKCNSESQNPISTFAQYFYQIALPSGFGESLPTGPEEMQGNQAACQPQLSQEAPVLKTTVNCSNELTEMYTRHRGSHRSRKRRKHHEHSAPPRMPQCGSWENIISASPKEHGNLYKVSWRGRFPPDFEKRVLERAYFLCINGVSEDEVYNYFEALRIELGQRPYEI